ncbi:MAG: flagellar filament capping protein FliD, partial [Phycisphaerales bacterium]|nr:flagellar filament capping protein FliD [Phycisphaerales bacterium]
GIDTGTLIEQLLSLQARPQILAQQRIVQLQTQQAAYLDVNSRLNTLKSASSIFRTGNIFKGKNALSNNESALTATAGIGAQPGSYSFIVDRLVSSQQMLSRGFADSDNSAIGLDSITIEGSEARLDRETALADLNNGNGITRGKITVNGTQVDLSRVSTVSEVLEAISAVDGVTATVANDHIELSGVTSITQANGAGVLESLGLDGTIVANELVGTSIHALNAFTALTSLNDGRGVSTRDTVGVGVYDFEIVVEGAGAGGADAVVGVRLGEIIEEVGGEVTDGAVSSLGGVIDRMNEALDREGITGVTASIDAATGAIAINDTGGRGIAVRDITVGSTTYTTATDLGIVGFDVGGSLTGERIFAGMNSTLISSLNGGSGLGGATSNLELLTSDGATVSIDVTGLNDFNDIINTINNDTLSNNGRVTASLNDAGNGIKIVDNTTGGSTFTVTTSDTATALGLDGAYADGVANGTNLQLAYLGRATLLSDLNNGAGIGTGKFEIVDSNNVRTEINITSSETTLGDIIDAINSDPNLAINARINDTGDGIIIEETGTPGAAPITITDTTGSVASKLRIAGTASGTGADNFIDGSYETTIEFAPDATLQEIVNEVNSASAGVTLSIVNTGTGTAPYRLNIASNESGTSGRFIVDTNGFDLGLSTLDEGNDARIFYGSSDPALGVLLSSSSNQFDNIIQGVTIDIHSTSDTPVELSITRNTADIESKINEFITAFNAVIDNIDFQTRYDPETEVRGNLLGDGTINTLRNGLFSTLRRPNDGFTATFDTLVEAGITVGKGGKLEFDAEKFRDAYAEDPQAIESLFTRRTLADTDDDDPNTDDTIVLSEQGAMVQMEEFVDRYVTSIGGILQNRGNALQSQIDTQQDRIDQLQLRLESQRAVLERQFLAMEQAIAASQSQSSSLAQIAALG